MQGSHVSGVEKCLMPLNIHATDLNMNIYVCVCINDFSNLFMVGLAKKRLDLNDFVSYLLVIFQLAYT